MKNNNIIDYSVDSCAIYGGTFDPVHVGHILLAERAIQSCNLDELIFMPAFISPFKQDQKSAEANARLDMLASILDYNPRFRLSDYEIQKQDTSYTIETLDEWSGLIDGKLSLVVGFDSIMEIDTWCKGPEILQKFPIITGVRPGISIESALLHVEMLRYKYNADITVLDNDEVDVSSSEIRERIKTSESISGLVTTEVEEYILEHQLYQ